MRTWVSRTWSAQSSHVTLVVKSGSDYLSACLRDHNVLTGILLSIGNLTFGILVPKL
ncbi:uncharacterized protein BO88DRAFT_402068 [Aspergillus vadensis CBS 113365]|uniref:Uncharacterized protein n=1 Tax=Aspergillus vadensis (strain CBS 113365 / IMI 142717 / IBT 24658) TaxID=1448311 RepID=A0A319BPD1_ASPVC|nr:hypothetical protein BO88DRAFT_402068 [Aspergillus vadensis CBS 113365]PYH73010.1 hypothetical protein BO88DRAFT_402068 [Aspergillus vadensis CBS 113365]